MHATPAGQRPVYLQDSLTTGGSGHRQTPPVPGGSLLSEQPGQPLDTFKEAAQSGTETKIRTGETAPVPKSMGRTGNKKRKW